VDQQTVEALLRRLVERRESERRYGEALEERMRGSIGCRRRMRRAMSAPEETATLGWLHDQVSALARRWSGKHAADDFSDRQALSADGCATDRRADPFRSRRSLQDARRPFKRSNTSGSSPRLRPRPTGERVRLTSVPDHLFRFAVRARFLFAQAEDRALDMRLGRTHQLEHSIGTAIPDGHRGA
jgi:hypothetical protein